MATSLGKIYLALHPACVEKFGNYISKISCESHNDQMEIEEKVTNQPNIYGVNDLHRNRHHKWPKIV